MLAARLRASTTAGLATDDSAADDPARAAREPGAVLAAVAVNAFVGAMVGLERSTLPIVGREEFGVASSAAVLSFIVAFGLAKALTNLAAGTSAARLGRRRLLITGWALALPVPLLIAVAPNWAWIVAANVLLGVNQRARLVHDARHEDRSRRTTAPRSRPGSQRGGGLRRRGVAAALSGWLAGDFVPRDVLVAAGADERPPSLREAFRRAS